MKEPNRYAMHDKILAAKIVDEARKHGDVEEITVEVGQLSGLTAEEIQKALESIVSWRVQTKSREAIVKCSCGYEGPAKVMLDENSDVSVSCPECKGVPKVIAGDRVVLKDVLLKEKIEGS